MADIGTLSIEITDNSEASAGGLNNLANALQRVKRAVNGVDLSTYAQGIKRLNAAIESGANSYHTLTYLATALNKVKAACSGLKFPDFAKLESLARSLQENYNAAEALKKIAAGMNEVKAASEGFKMPNLTALEKLQSTMQGKSGGTTTAQQLQQATQAVSAGKASDFENVGQRIEQATEQTQAFTNGMQEVNNTGLDFSKFKVEDLPIQSLGVQLRDAENSMSGFADMAKDSYANVQRLPMVVSENLPAVVSDNLPAVVSDNLPALVQDNLPAVIPQPEVQTAQQDVMGPIQQMTEGTTTLILYNENLENTWERICQRMSEAEQKQKALVAAARPAGYGTVQDVSGVIASTNLNGSNMGERLRGELGPQLQNLAIKDLSQGTGVSENDIRRQIDEIGERALITQGRIKDMMASLNQPAPGISAQGIDQMMGINAVPKSAADSASVFQGTEAAQQIKEIIDTLNTPVKFNTADAIDRMQGIGAASKDAADSASVFMNALQSGTDDASVRLQELNPEIEETGTSLDGTAESGRSFSDRLRSIGSGLENVREGFNRLRGAISGSAIGKLADQFGRLAKRMAMRAIIKAITRAFKEGTENVYRYNEAIGGTFSKDMDNAASSLEQMKNSIGAAVAPAIQMLLPVLQQVVNGFITVINYVNQFFSLMRGQQTWTRALPVTTKAFDNQTKAAKKTGSAIKDLLADWDELNIIQSEGGGSGGSTGKTAEDYLSMFEEVGTFENKVKKLVDFIKDNFETIKSIVMGIGAAMLTWKISNALGHSLGFLQKLELAAGITLMIEGVKMTTAAGYDIGKNGLNSENMLQAAAGVFETALGGGLVGVAFGGIAGGLLGFTIGASIALLFLAYSIGEGELDKLYGDISLSADEIEEEVKKLFTFDVNVALENATVDHESIEKARAEVIKTARNMNADFVTFKLKLTPESAAELLGDVNDTVDAANSLLKFFQHKISIGFGFEINYSNPNIVQQFSTEKLTGLESYITGLGTKIGEILEDGIVNGIDEQRLLEDTMRKLTNVTNAIALGKTSGRFAAELERDNYGRDWTKIDRKSVIAYAKKYTEGVESVRNDAYLQALDTRGALKGIYYGMVQRNIDEPGTYTEEEIQEAWDNYNNYDMQAAIEDYTEKATAEGKEIFTNNMMEVFHSAINKKLLNGRFDTSKWTKTPGGLTDGAGLVDWMNKNMAVNLGWNEKEFAEVMDTMGISALDLVEGDTRSKYINTIIDVLGENKDTYSRLKNELAIPIDEILTVKQSDWDKWSVKSRKAYIANLSQAYGGAEVLRALRDSGVDLKDIVDIGMQFEGQTRDSYFRTLQSMYGKDAVQAMLSVSGYNYNLPWFDPTMTIESADEAASAVEDMATRIRAAFESINGMGLNLNFGHAQRILAGIFPTMVETRAMGGPITSGDLVMANENGNIEMMGRMGSQPVVANNQQIVNGISQGVSNANGEVVGELRTLGTMLQRILAKEIVAKVVPSSSMGRNNRQSAYAYDKVTG